MFSSNHPDSNQTDAADQMLIESKPVGFRFYPTDDEIIHYYLYHKMNGHDSLVSNICEVDICKYEPWQLPEISVIKSDDPEWFFFCPYEFKYSNSDRKNRKTVAGFWKPTGEIRKIKSRGCNELIGTKKTLVYYKGNFKKSESTCWVMHEYHATPTAAHKKAYYICRLMRKVGEKCSGNWGCTNKFASSSQVQSPRNANSGVEAGVKPFTRRDFESQIYDVSSSSSMPTLEESSPTSWDDDVNYHWLQYNLANGEEQKQMDEFFETVLTDQDD